MKSFLAAMLIVLALTLSASAQPNGQVVDVQHYAGNGSMLLPYMSMVTIKLDQGTYSAIFNEKFASKIVVGSDVEARVDGDKLVIDWPGEKEHKSKIVRRAQ